MRLSNLNSQHGAVLAFSLVMLLLLTITGTRMIQQNKQQLEMANSTRLLTQEFANAEGLLEEAKNLINEKPAHVDRSGTLINDSAHLCEPTADFKQNILLAGADLFKNNSVLDGKVNILAVSCMSVPTNDPADPGNPAATPPIPPKKVSCRKQCSSYDGTLITPYKLNTIKGDGKECLTNICNQPYDPWGDVSATTKGQCPKEIYTIQVISTSVSGTKKTIISDHVVGCG